MVDNMNGEPPVSTPEPKPTSPVVAFLSSSTGKLVVGGVILFAVLVAVGALAFFFLLSPTDQTTVTTPPVTGTTEPTETAVPTDPPEQALDETFTFRNVFAPTVSPPVAADEADSGTSSDDASATADIPEDTLVLLSIRTESGERVATFYWNGSEYDAMEGDQVADSPWEVVTINSDSVVMLYGDSRVTLTVGQGYGDGGVVSK